jgi:proteasome lid subunit RPN8/RPN11
MKSDLRSLDEKELPERPAPKVRQELRILIGEAAFDRAVARGAADLGREVGGILVGEVLRDEAGPYLLVDATIDALHAEEKGAELTFTHATWEHIHKELDSGHPGKKVVGWYHTHPGFGIFLSDRDQFIHKSFFDLPFQIALVYDPKSREHGVFAWRDGEPVRQRRYYVGSHEHLWESPRSGSGSVAGATATPTSAPAPTAAPAPAAAAPAPAPALAARDPGRGFPVPLDFTTLAIAGVVVLILGLAGGWWLGTRASRDALAQAQLDMAQAQVRGAREVVAAMNPALLATLRAGLDGVEQRAWDDTIAALGAVVASLQTAAPKDGSLVEPIAKLAAVRARMMAIAAGRHEVERGLADLEAAISHQGGVDPREVARLRHALATLYGDLAVEVAARDPGRARGMLRVAASLDPTNLEHYQQQLRAFDPQATLSAAPAGAPAAPEAARDAGR